MLGELLGRLPLEDVLERKELFRQTRYLGNEVFIFGYIEHDIVDREY
jgi:hypothetical protein